MNLSPTDLDACFLVHSIPSSFAAALLDHPSYPLGNKTFPFLYLPVPLPSEVNPSEVNRMELTEWS